MFLSSFTRQNVHFMRFAYTDSDSRQKAGIPEPVRPVGTVKIVLSDQEAGMAEGFRDVIEIHALPHKDRRIGVPGRICGELRDAEFGGYGSESEVAEADLLANQVRDLHRGHGRTGVRKEESVRPGVRRIAPALKYGPHFRGHHGTYHLGRASGADCLGPEEPDLAVYYIFIFP